MLVFDIETTALDDKTLAARCPPFEPPPHPGEFDPASVRYGNTKDPDKRAVILADARAKHEAAVALYDRDRTALAEQHFADFKAKAALDATTGRVCAIGYLNGDTGKLAIDDGGGDEAKLISKFWKKYTDCRSNPISSGGPRKLIGANIFQFDLPFLVRRSWILGVEVPSHVKPQRYWDIVFVDVREVWLLGQRWGDCSSSLDTMARALGCGGKPDGVNGADFGRLWNGTAEEREKAVAYLRNDLAMTAAVAKRLGVV